MRRLKRKAIIDDGMNPELVRGAVWDGYLGIPLIRRPKEFIIPSEIVPFSKRKCATRENSAIGFYEMDSVFAEILVSPQSFVSEFRQRFYIEPKGVRPLLSPDCSLYRDAPLAVQITNVYRNRAIGYYYQRNGIYVIPSVRWGNALTYTTKILREKVAFLGVEKHSIVAVSAYGCFKTRDDKYHFEAGLSEMMETLEPKIVLVYGAKNGRVFEPYAHSAQFVFYADWIAQKRRKFDKTSDSPEAARREIALFSGDAR